MVSNEKICWDIIKQFNFNSPPTICLGRSQHVMDKYHEHKKILNSKNIKIGDYIYSKYFINDTEYNLVLNSFPYNCEDNISHYILWLNPKIFSNKKINEIEIKNYICYKLFNNDYENIDKNCIYFQNITALQSIKAIPHIQIFIRN